MMRPRFPLELEEFEDAPRPLVPGSAVSLIVLAVMLAIGGVLSIGGLLVKLLLVACAYGCPL